MIPGKLTALLALLALCIGLWAGDAWRAGRVAVAQNKALLKQQADDRKTISDLQTAAAELRQHAVDATLAYQQASDRLNTIAQQLEQDREANRQFAQQQRDALATLAQARPDLRSLHLGPDVLRHWQQSNRGAPATAPAAADPGQPAHAVPAAAAAGQRRGAGPDRQP